MMFRKSVVLAAVAALAFGAGAQASPVSFSPAGNGTGLISNVTGFVGNTGSTLNAGAQTAVANAFAGSGSTQFTSFSQATTNNVSTTTIAMSIGGGFTIVFGTTENIVGHSGTNGGSGSNVTLGLVPGGPVNYVQVFAANTGTSNAAGTGFNNGTLILSATLINNFTNIPIVSISNSSGGALDQSGSGLYPGNNTVALGGSVIVQGTITFFNPNYFVPAAGETLLGATINFNTNLSDPFNSVSPSAAFLTNSLISAVGIPPTTAGAGLGTANGAFLDIGPTNGGLGNGQSNEVQNQPNFTFTGIPQSSSTPTVPEPTSLVVFGALVGLGGFVYRKRRNAKTDTATAC